jgi:uncharacterized protein YjiS (DUF1127 family)
VSDHAREFVAFPRRRKSILPRYPLVHRLALMLEAWRTRRILAELDSRLLKDIGVSRSEAQAEAARALWDFELRR